MLVHVLDVAREREVCACMQNSSAIVKRMTSRIHVAPGLTGRKVVMRMTSRIAPGLPGCYSSCHGHYPCA